MVEWCVCLSVDFFGDETVKRKKVERGTSGAG